MGASFVFFKEVLESLAVLLGVLAKGEDSSVKAKWTVLDRLVDWWHDIRVALGGVLTSLEHIRHGTAIQLKNIENTWRDLSNHYNRYTSQVPTVHCKSMCTLSLIP